MYSMKEVCQMTGLSYETLKFYCNQGLIPNVQRDSGNRRVFTEYQIGQIHGLLCLKDCGMGVTEMKQYMGILTGENPDVPALKAMLARKQETLEETIRRAQESLKFIAWKQEFYDAVLRGDIGLFDLPPLDEEMMKNIPADRRPPMPFPKKEA